MTTRRRFAQWLWLWWGGGIIINEFYGVIAQWPIEIIGLLLLLWPKATRAKAKGEAEQSRWQ
jgi:hypothetical protein